MLNRSDASHFISRSLISGVFALFLEFILHVLCGYNLLTLRRLVFILIPLAQGFSDVSCILEYITQSSTHPVSTY